ncbi:MAG: pilus assembly protein TadG-related protein [Blastocatellia bacterium]
MPRNALSICRPRTSERGNILVFTAVTLLVLLGIMALAIDVGHMLNGRAQLQNALDAAALASVAQTHVTIEPANNKAEQLRLVREYAKKFALLNKVSNASGGSTPITLGDADIDVSRRGDEVQPVISLTSRIPLPTFFAGILGFDSVNIAANASASVMQVDGGTGVISGGLIGTVCSGTAQSGLIVSGCWRPILIPDTYFDAAGNVHNLASEFIDPTETNLEYIREPPAGAYYRSRFATSTGPRSVFPFVDSYPDGIGAGTEITGLRDAHYGSDQINNLMGSRFIVERDNRITNELRFRVVDFASTYPTYTNQTTPGQQTLYGYCGLVRIGDRVKVFPPTEHKDVPTNLYTLRNLTINYIDVDDEPPNGALLKYGYVRSKAAAASGPCRFETPNSYPSIIPVLLCDPFDFYRRRKVGDTEFTVTNFGAIFIETAGFDGEFAGYFVRETVIGGTPLEPANKVRLLRFLPVSLRLMQS